MDRAINRRNFLRGASALLALPSLEALGASTKSPVRLAFVYTPNGAIMPKWKPNGSGNDWSLSPTLSSFAPVKDKIQVISGLAHDRANANGDGGGDHARATATFLTGQQARKTAGSDISLGKSVDQYAAEVIGKDTRLDSLQLGCDRARKAGRCDSGYSCAYQYNFSWKSDNLPLAPEIDPRVVFEKMFGAEEHQEDKVTRERRLRHERSLLDFVMEDAKSLQRSLGREDQQKLEEYLQGVREAERKVESAEKRSKETGDVERKKPEGIPNDYQEHIRMMYEMMLLAFESDTTRVASFLVAHDGSNRSFREIGVSEGHHSLSHHRRDGDKISKLEKIDRFYADQFAWFLKRMKESKDFRGENLLDQSMIVYGGGISDADRHDHNDLPVILAGGGGGHLRMNRHLHTRQDVPMTNLYLSLLDKVGVQLNQLGDSTGRFDLI